MPFVFFPYAAVPGAAISSEEIPSGMNAAALVKQQHFAGYHSDLGVLVKGIDDFSGPVRLDFGVIVQ